MVIFLDLVDGIKTTSMKETPKILRWKSRQKIKFYTSLALLKFQGLKPILKPCPWSMETCEPEVQQTNFQFPIQMKVLMVHQLIKARDKQT